MMSPAPAWTETNEPEPWMDELLTCLSATGQFVLAGNVHDLCLLPGAKSLVKHESLTKGLTKLLKDDGYEYVLAWDRVSGLYLVSSDHEDPMIGHVEQLLEIDQLGIQGDGSRIRVGDLHTVLGPVVTDDRRGALVIDYASRLIATESDPHLSDEMLNLFVVAEKLSREVAPAVDRPHNPLVWLVDKDRDLPTWFVNNNDGVRVITVPKPDRSLRSFVAHKYWLEGLEMGDSDPEQAARTFAKHTSGMTLRGMQDIWRLARSRPEEKCSGAETIEQAARSYRVGLSRNPWSDPDLRKKVAAAEDDIARGVGESGVRVFGQDHAVEKAVDILMRSSLGLSSAQAQGNAAKPRGVLFLAGPTGVGKTQLAKAINQIVFDAEEPIRFDMSEFAAEHAEARLIGSPPGYVGHGQGGELTNAIRQRPFSVVLFDELEKAHYKIFDKFLQILDEGRLTDGSGQTVHFSESIIIFTTNWGMTRETVVDHGDGEQKVHREKRSRREYLTPAADGTTKTDYERFSNDVTDAIVAGFEQMGRPELLNRIGHDNIIVFDFINEEAARSIFDDAVESVKSRVLENTGTAIELDASVVEQLWDFAWRRCSEQEMGGRGIGAAVETALVNPLGRLFYEQPDTDFPPSLRVHAAEELAQSGRWKLQAS